jgi:hypothetical protein
MNQNIKILKTEILSDNWYTLKKVSYEYLKKDNSLQIQTREAYDGEMEQPFFSIIKNRKL